MILDRKGLAEHYQVSLRTVDTWIKDRRVPFIKIGHNVRFDLDDVNQSLKARFQHNPITRSNRPIL